MSQSKFLSDDVIEGIKSCIHTICNIHSDKHQYQNMKVNCLEKLEELISYTNFIDVYQNIWSISSILSKAEPHYNSDKLNKCCKERDRYIYNDWGDGKDKWAVYTDSFGIDSSYNERECYWENMRELERVIIDIREGRTDNGYTYSSDDNDIVLELVKEVLDNRDIKSDSLCTVTIDSITDEDDEGNTFIYNLDCTENHDTDDELFEIEFSKETSDYIKTNSLKLINELYPKYVELKSSKDSKEFTKVVKEIVSIGKEIERRYDEEFYYKYKECYWDKIHPNGESGLSFQRYDWDDHIELFEDFGCMKLCQLFAETAEELEEKYLNK